MLTNEQIAEIRARCEAATPGPWNKSNTIFAQDDGRNYGVMDDEANMICADIENKANAEFIAHARQDIPALLAALEAERAKVEKSMEALLMHDTALLWNELEKWKCRAEALERALADYQGVVRCRKYCVNADIDYCSVDAWICKNEDRPFNRKTQSYQPRCKNWQFDEARFAGDDNN